MKLSSLDAAAAFVAVARHRSFTAAAAELGVTRSAVSQTIKGFEQRLGVALLARTTRDVGLTEAGAALYAELAPVIGTVGRAIERMAEYSGRPAGLLRLNLPHIAVPLVIEPLLAGFLQAHPQVQIEVFCDDALANIVESGFDAGIRLGEMVAQDMVSVRLTPPTRTVVIGSAAYFERHGVPQRPEDLVRHECVNYRQISRGSLYRWEFQRDGEEFEIAVKGRVIANDTPTLMRAALDGLGLVSHLESVVRPWIERGDVRSVLDDYSVPTPGFFLYFPARAQVLPKLRAFIEYARAHLATTSQPEPAPAAQARPKPRLKWDVASRSPQPLLVPTDPARGD
jgi:DNA-binding transcriptional LysR family regulator